MKEIYEDDIHLSDIKNNLKENQIKSFDDIEYLISLLIMQNTQKLNKLEDWFQDYLLQNLILSNNNL